METAQILGIGFVVLVLLWLVMKMHSRLIYRFYRPGCPHCVNSKSEWDKFTMMCYVRAIRPVSVNLDDPGNKELADKYRVSGVPTVVKVLDNENFVVHNGPRTATDYMKFATE